MQISNNLETFLTYFLNLFHQVEVKIVQIQPNKAGSISDKLSDDGRHLQSKMFYLFFTVGNSCHYIMCPNSQYRQSLLPQVIISGHFSLSQFLFEPCSPFAVSISTIEDIASLYFVNQFLLLALCSIILLGWFSIFSHHYIKVRTCIIFVLITNRQDSILSRKNYYISPLLNPFMEISNRFLTVSF